MGRIREAFTRLSGASVTSTPDDGTATEPRAASMLEAFTVERSPARDDDGDDSQARVRRASTRLRGRRDSDRVPTSARTPFMVAATAAGAPATPMGLPSLTSIPTLDPDKLIDVHRIADYVGFVGRAVLRHKALSSLAFVLTLGLTAATALLWPQSWRVSAKLLVQRNEVMSSLVNPTRTIPREAESPTRAAEENVLRRDNLVSIVQQTNLVEEWERTRAPVFKVKDRVSRLIRPEPSGEERIEAMVGLLERDLHVNTEPSGVVNFWIQWRDPRLAYEIVDQAINNFLQDRRQSETLAIADSITILDRSVETLEAQVNRTIRELPRRPDPRARRAPAVVAAAAAAVVAPVAPTLPEVSGPAPEILTRLARIKASLDARQQEFVRLEGQRRQELTQAQGRLAAASTIYTDGHPTVVGLRQSVTALAQESPEEQTIRRAVDSLEQEHDTLSAVVLAATLGGDESKRAVARGAAEPTSAPTPNLAPAFDYSYSDLVSSEANDPTSLRLKVELAQLASVRERANAARAELASSQAGFKYQYNVIRPPRIPRQPTGPNIPAILVAGMLASLLLALFGAVAADLAGGLIVEPWQVERLVGVPVAIRVSAL